MNFDNPWIIGIGVFIIGSLLILPITELVKVIVKFLKNRISERKKRVIIALDQEDFIGEVIHKSISPSVDMSKPRLDITPKTILEEINNAPPLQRNKVAENYEGIRVSWKGYIRSGLDMGEQGTFIQIGWQEDKFTTICCYADTDIYPELKVIKEHQLVTIQGTIESVKKFAIFC